jgi:flagellar basal body P-ring formation protein FlgA
MKPVVSCVLAAAMLQASAAAAASFGREEVVSALARALVERGAGDRLELEFANREIAVEGPEARLTVELLDFDRESRRFVALIGAGGERSRLAGRAFQLFDVPIPARPLAAGELIDEADLEWQAVRADRLDRNAATAAAQLVGMTPTRGLKPGRVVRTSEVRPPVLVAKGALVTMSVSAPGLTLTATGRALDEGAEGDLVRVLNVQSKRTVEGVVAGQNQVRIPALQRLAAKE